MIISLIRLIPCPDKREVILRILQSMIPATLAKPGCEDCSVYEEYDAEQSILYSEQWQSEKDLNRHIQSNLYLRVLNAIDFAKDQPQVSFHHVTTTESEALIESLRSESANHS
jgi:quinol monooxygenase YgiN